jgi:hypothetical protein
MQKKTPNPQLLKLKKGDVFRFKGKKAVYVINWRQNNRVYYYRWDDINAHLEISKFTAREIETDFEF